MSENSSIRKLFETCSCLGDIQLSHATNNIKSKKRRKKKVEDDISPKGYLKQTDARNKLMGLLACSE